MNEGRDNIYVVINLGSSSLTGLLAHKTSDGLVRPIKAHHVPTGGCIRQGCIHNIEETARLISLLIDTLSEALPSEETITGVYVGLECRSMQAETFRAQMYLGAEGRVVTQDDLLTLRDEVNEAEYPGMKILSITDPRYRADGKREYTPRGVRCQHLEADYQLILVRQNIVANIEEVIVSRLGLRLLGIIPTPIAEAAATLTTEESALGCAYVNIGGGTTSIAIYQERLLSALYILPIGGINVTRDLTHLNNRLMESDAESLKARYGSMDTSVSRGEQIQVPSTTGEETKVFVQHDVNRYINARIREILKNVISIIAEAGFAEAVPKGLVFSGGVTETKYFYETLRKLRFEFREGHLRRDVYDEQVRPELARQYATVIALASRATEPGVTFEVRPLDSIMHEPEEYQAKPSAYSKEEAELDYTFEDHAEAMPEDEEPTRTSQSHPSRSSSKGSWLGNTLNKLSSLFDTDEED